VRLKGLFILGADAFDMIYGPDERRDIGQLVDLPGAPQTAAGVAENPGVLGGVDVIFSGWGAPLMDAAFLRQARSLKAVFYGAGSVKGFVSDALWDRDVVVTSAYGVNGRPVAEYALASILFSLKRGWEHVFDGRDNRRWPRRLPVPGAYGTTVAVISLGVIGRYLCELLKPLDLEVIAYDPFVSQEEAERLGVEMVGLDAAFERAEVVSLHTPDLPETRGMIQGRHFRAMKPHAAFINTARGAVVNEPEMIETLAARPDIMAVLDVTSPEPPAEGSPLYTLPNVVLTPHIAGSMDGECRRMGRCMVEECGRWLRGEPLRWQVTRDMVPRLA
jgi:phosphoglycerate dehydrogenase-like enzyme